MFSDYFHRFTNDIIFKNFYILKRTKNYTNQSFIEELQYIKVRVYYNRSTVGECSVIKMKLSSKWHGLYSEALLRLRSFGKRFKSYFQRVIIRLTDL